MKPTFTFTFEFNSRETYLFYKEDWKKRYAEASLKQRALKKLIKGAMKAGSPAYRHQWDYLSGADAANKLLAERAASKKEASKQWEAQRSS